MKVLYFSRDYTTHDRRFLLKLAESSHEICFLRLENDGIPYEQRPLPKQVRVIEWAGGQQKVKTPEDWLRLAPFYEAVLAKVRPDVVHAGPVQSCGFLTALVGFRPLLLASWGSDILIDAERDRFWEWITRYTLARSDKLLCDCNAVRQKVQKLTEYSDNRVVQFPWGIDPRCYKPGRDTTGLRHRLGWEDAFVVLSTRSWEPIYGIDVLLEAFRQAYTENPKLRLLLLGAGSLAPQVQQWIRGGGIQCVVNQPGVVSQEHGPDYFRAADLYLSCAHSDGTSVSLLEALGTGLPVVVTDAPGNREWVTPGVAGWLAPAGEPKVFAQALLDAAALNGEHRARFRENNRQLVERRADWDANFPKLLAAYEEIYHEYHR